MIDPKLQMKWLVALVEGLSKQKFFGRLEIHIQSGNIIQITKVETLKIEQIDIEPEVSTR